MSARLTELIERFTGCNGSHETSIAGLMLHRQTEPSEAVAGLARPSLCVIAQGSKQVMLGDEIYRYDPEHFLIFSLDLPVASQIVSASPESPYLSLSIELDQAMVCELAAQVEATGQAGAVSAVAVSAVEPPLYDAVARLVALLESPRDAGVLAPLVLREIVYRLLVGAQGQRLRQLFVAEGSAQRILRILRWLREHYSEPLRIEDLAREAHLSPSALHLHFKNVTAMSPLQYQKQLRLHEARRLMLSSGLDAAEASFRVGYESPSQFSREYRRQFGAPPRQDVEGARAQPAQRVVVTS